MSREVSTARRRKARRRGLGAERIAALWLMLKGYRIVGRAVRTPVGEIDLIVARGRLIAFVEVKRRASLAISAEAIGNRQRQRIARAAAWWMAQERGVASRDLRFDAMLIAPRRVPRHIKDAWRLDPG